MDAVGWRHGGGGGGGEPGSQAQVLVGAAYVPDRRDFCSMNMAKEATTPAA